jgi:hypothetical protein
MNTAQAIQTAALFLEREDSPHNVLYQVLDPDTRTAIHALLDVARGSSEPYQRPPDSRERQTGDALYQAITAHLGRPTATTLTALACACEDWACLRTDQQGEDSRC